MNNSDKWFRWSFNAFIFLMCFQVGSLIFLKGILYQAEQRMKNNEAVVDFKCGDFNTGESYWEIQKSSEYFSHACLDGFCPDSYWKAPGESSEDNLHILSVQRPQPTYMKDGERKLGHYVDVNVEESSKAKTLVLISQQMMQWNLKMQGSQTLGSGAENEAAKIQPEQVKEVIVLSPELVWVEGISKDVKVTYFSKEQLCAYPVAWEESENPENQYRRLVKAINEYTGMNVTSFQGIDVGRSFNVPLKSPLLVQRDSGQEESRSISSQTEVSMGLKWERNEKSLQANSFQFIHGGELKTVNVPKKTMEAFYEAVSKKLYVIENHQFGYWDWEKKKFTSIHLPLKLPNMYWPTTMTFNPLTSEIIIYNDDRGGELYSFNVVTNKWKRLAQKVGYSMVALHYDHNNKKLFGARYQGKSIAELVTLSSEGKNLKTVPFTKPLHFSKNRWKAEIVAKENQYWLKVAHPAQPAGDLYPLQEVKHSL